MNSNHYQSTLLYKRIEIVDDSLSLSSTKNTLLFITFSFLPILHPPPSLLTLFSFTLPYSSPFPLSSFFLSSSYSFYSSLSSLFNYSFIFISLYSHPHLLFSHHSQ